MRTDSSISIVSGGRLLTNSVSRRAGTVMAPSSSMRAPIQQLTPISRLVAGQAQLIILCLQQDISEHRQCTAGRYRATDD